MNIAPLVRLVGTVRRVQDRTVPAVEARAAEYDDAGTLVRAAREAREAYVNYDVVVDTNPGGLVEVIMTPEAQKLAEGYLPAVGDEVELPARPFVRWQGTATRRWPVVGYSFAGDVHAADHAASSGARIAAAS